MATTVNALNRRSIASFNSTRTERDEGAAGRPPRSRIFRPAGVALCLLRLMKFGGFMPKASTRARVSGPTLVPSAPHPLPDGDFSRSVSVSSEPNEQDIRLRAYHRYLER